MQLRCVASRHIDGSTLDVGTRPPNESLHPADGSPEERDANRRLASVSAVGVAEEFEKELLLVWNAVVEKVPRGTRVRK